MVSFFFLIKNNNIKAVNDAFSLIVILTLLLATYSLFMDVVVVV